jgi:hypothetical protein
MKKKIKKLWLDALRSGEYAQGKGFLVSDGIEADNFCCLGVLTDIAVEHGIVEWENDDELNYIQDEDSEYREKFFLPDEVIQWAGLNDQTNIQRILAQMNDSGSSFDSIADVIEKEL